MNLGSLGIPADIVQGIGMECRGVNADIKLKLYEYCITNDTDNFIPKLTAALDCLGHRDLAQKVGIYTPGNY